MRDEEQEPREGAGVEETRDLDDEQTPESGDEDRCRGPSAVATDQGTLVAGDLVRELTLFRCGCCKGKRGFNRLVRSLPLI